MPGAGLDSPCAHLRPDRRPALGGGVVRVRGALVHAWGLRTSDHRGQAAGRRSGGDRRGRVYDAVDHIAQQDAGPSEGLAGELRLHRVLRPARLPRTSSRPRSPSATSRATTGAGPSSRRLSTWHCTRRELTSPRPSAASPDRSTSSARCASAAWRRALLDRAAARPPRRLPHPALQARPDQRLGRRADRGAGRTGAVDSLDLKGNYKGTPVDVETDPELYAKLIEAFPEAWLEDPDVTEETRPLLEPVAERVTWDAPIHSVADIEAMPWAPPKTVNVKPSRFGAGPQALRRLRLLRGARDRRLRRRPDRAGPGPRPDPVPGLDLPPRHPQRRRPQRLQRSRAGDGARPADQPAGAGDR